MGRLPDVNVGISRFVEGRGSVLECGGAPPLLTRRIPIQSARGLAHSKTSRNGLGRFMGLASVPISGATPASNLKLETARLSSPKSSSSRAALSLIEILVTITLLVVIILGLTAMFDQTRKAFTIGLGNVDYQDAGRTAMDLISRDLEQMAPSDLYSGINFYSDVSPAFSPGVAWPMLGSDATNFSMQRLYFITRSNLQWNVSGYCLIPTNATNGVGTLYRYGYSDAPTPYLQYSQPTNLLNDFTNYPPIYSPLSRVIDNVVDFRIRAYDRNGFLIPTSFVPLNGGFTGNATNAPSGTLPSYGELSSPLSVTPLYLTQIFYSLQPTDDYQYTFGSNAVPAYVEVELGILETPTVAQLQAYTNTQAAYWQFLTNHAAQVHIFRQRVSIPAVDPTAYYPFQ
jgi:hypothetical protein